MFLSIIVPIYNAEKHLSRCLSSILQSRSDNLELILIDDGSTDGSSNICIRQVNSDKRVRYIRQSNAGVSSARNKGLEVACGDYVLFVDADDSIDSSLINDIFDAVKMRAYDLIRYGIQTVDEDGRVIETFVPSVCSSENCHFLLYQLSRGPDSKLLHFCSYAVKRSVIEQNRIRFYEACRYGEDQEFTHKVVASAQSCYTLGRVYYYYHQNRESSMHSISLEQLQYIGAFERVKDFPRIRTDFAIRRHYEREFLPYISIATITMLYTRGLSYYAIKEYMKENRINEYRNPLYLRYDLRYLALQVCRAFPKPLLYALRNKYDLLRKWLLQSVDALS